MTEKQKRELEKTKIIRAVIIIVAAISMICAEVIMISAHHQVENAEDVAGTATPTPVQQTETTSTNVSIIYSMNYLTYLAETEKPTEPVEEATEEVKIYWAEVPLDEEIQKVLVECCEKYSVPLSIALGLMERESSFRTEVVSKSNDYGLCQINECNHEWLAEELGITDVLDPEQNIECGMFILGSLYEKYQDWNMALMCYNCGENGAYNNYFSKGEYSNGYSSSVLEYSEKWESVVNE